MSKGKKTIFPIQKGDEFGSQLAGFFCGSYDHLLHNFILSVTSMEEKNQGSALPKTNIAPENRPLEEGFLLENPPFSGASCSC